MRIALFGGTFDPIHWGHLLLAESARVTYHLDRILFIPNGIPPHKGRPTASAADRLRMVRLATASNPQFDVSDWEIRQKRAVYSYETIAHFKKSGHRLFFIVGADSLRNIDLWVKGRSLLKQCSFLVADRSGIPWGKLPASLRRQSHRILWPFVPLASHDIRECVRRGQSIRYQVPESVGRYIQSHRLYRGTR